MTEKVPEKEREIVARALKKKMDTLLRIDRQPVSSFIWPKEFDELADAILAALGLADGSHVIVPVEPTRAMQVAAREWSRAKYGKPIGSDAAGGCWTAMLTSAKEADRG